jgi:hypothetical protein
MRRAVAIDGLLDRIDKRPEQPEPARLPADALNSRDPSASQVSQLPLPSAVRLE